MLGDENIDAWLDILKKKFGESQGLEGTLVLAYPQLPGHHLKKIKNFVRIMLSRDNHWICVAGKKMFFENYQIL